MCKAIPAGFMVDPAGMLVKENGASIDEGARIPKKPGQPNKSDKHSDLYTDEDPKGTIHGLGFKDVKTAKQSVSKIRNSGRSHAHKIQAAIAMEQRARVAGKTSEAAVYRKFINSMKEKTKQMNEEGLRDWFGKSKSKDGKGGWVNVVTGGTCASDEPGEGTPKCVSSAKRASMTPAERLSAARRKKAADPGQQAKTGAAKPTYVSTDSPKEKTRKEEIDLVSLIEKKLCNHTKEGINCPCHGKKRCPVVLKSKDHEYSMARSELSTIMSAAKRLKSKMAKGEGNVEAWVQSKITKAADYLDSAADYVDSGEMNEESDKKGKGSGTKDACYHKVKSRYSVWPSAYASGALVKCRKVGAANWGNKSEEKITDRILNDILSEKCWPGYKKKGMKTMFGKRYPNCVKKENVTIEDAEGNTFAEVVDIIKPEPIKGFKSQIEEATRIQSQTGNVVALTILWRGKYYMLRMFFPQLKLPSRQEVTDEIQKVYPGSRLIAHSVSEFTPGQPMIQLGFQGGSLASSGPSKKDVKPYGEEVEYEEINEASPAWQRKEGKNPEGGLNKKGIASYRRENPGSKLSMAVTTPPSKLKPGSKAAKRRKSFCARMSGVEGPMKDEKGRPTRKALALRKWNC